MSDENKIKHKSFISFLDERNRIIEIFVEIVHADPAFVKFKTDGDNIIMIPTCRVLKIKEKEVEK